MNHLRTISIHFVAVLMWGVVGPDAVGQGSGLSFLQIGVDARAAGMGDAQVAVADGAFATFWNPAGLAGAGSNDIALSHHIWVGDVRTYAAAGRFGLGTKTGIGLAVTATSSGDLELRERPGPSDGTFDLQYLSLGASLGRRLGPARVGATGRYISEEIFTERASGYGFDLGLQFDVVGEALRVGAAVQNLGEMGELNSEATDLPTMLRVGLAVQPFRILALDDDFTLLNTTLVAELSHLFPDDRSRIHIGVAAEALDMLTVRAGLITNDGLRNGTLGLGLRYESLIFDYALVLFDEGFGGPGHVLTLSYGW